MARTTNQCHGAIGPSDLRLVVGHANRLPSPSASLADVLTGKRRGFERDVRFSQCLQASRLASRTKSRLTLTHGKLLTILPSAKATLNKSADLAQGLHVW